MAFYREEGVSVVYEKRRKDVKIEKRMESLSPQC